MITGDHRIHTKSELGGNLARGEAVRLAEPSQYRVDVISATPQSDGSVILRVCRIDDRVVYKPATGEVVDDDVATKTVDARMVNEGGIWKVAGTSLLAGVEGVASCAG